MLTYLIGFIGRGIVTPGVPLMIFCARRQVLRTGAYAAGMGLPLQMAPGIPQGHCVEPIFAPKKKLPCVERSFSCSVSRYSYRPYLFLNFSTRPPRWVNFCCPVKNGWQAEQMSVLISSCVDLVTNVLPHAQVTLHSLYSGWIPCFMLSPRFSSAFRRPADGFPEDAKGAAARGDSKDTLPQAGLEIKRFFILAAVSCSQVISNVLVELFFIDLELIF